MTLDELQKQLAQLPKLPPRTQVTILIDAKSGRIYAPIADVRFDGLRIVIEDGGVRW
jgi:hypothetical protein